MCVCDWFAATYCWEVMIPWKCNQLSVFVFFNLFWIKKLISQCLWLICSNILTLGGWATEMAPPLLGVVVKMQIHSENLQPLLGLVPPLHTFPICEHKIKSKLWVFSTQECKSWCEIQFQLKLCKSFMPATVHWFIGNIGCFEEGGLVWCWSFRFSCKLPIYRKCWRDINSKDSSHSIQGRSPVLMPVFISLTCPGIRQSCSNDSFKPRLKLMESSVYSASASDPYTITQCGVNDTV